MHRDYWIDRHLVPLRLVALAVLTLVGLVATRAIAGELTASWTPPVTNTDGTAIPATGAGSISGHHVRWGVCDDARQWTEAGAVGTVFVPMPATSRVVTNLAPGTWCVVVQAENTYGSRSANSNSDYKIIAPPTPNPPVVTVAKTAYDLTPRGAIGRVVGTVPLGTECTGAVVKRWADGTTFYAVPRDKVRLKLQPRSDLVVAKCRAA